MGVIARNIGTDTTRAVARPGGTAPFVNEGDHSSPAALSATDPSTVANA